MDLKSKLLDPAQAVLLYGTTPPRLGTAQSGIEAPANRAIYAALKPYLDGSQVKAA
jgi:hypothetical protein